MLPRRPLSRLSLSLLIVCLTLSLVWLIQRPTLIQRLVMTAAQGNNRDKTKLYHHQIHKRRAEEDERRKKSRLGLTRIIQELYNDLNLMAYLPEINCPYMVRLGEWWTCNPWELPFGCVVYSLGDGNASFEKDLNFATEDRCQLHVMDNSAATQMNFRGFKNVQFHYWRGAEQLKSVEFVDLLRISVDDNSLQLIKDVLSSEVTVCQLLVKVKIASENRGKLMQALKEIDRGGFLNFDSEITGDRVAENSGTRELLCEFGFVHRYCIRIFGISGEVVHKNFPL